MQAVILAAGKSTRTHPLTLTRPKPLLPVGGRPILQHNLEQLQGLVSEAIIVTGYREKMVRERFPDSFGKIKITYVNQERPNGTGSALKLCEPLLQDRFLVLMGDDVYSRQDIRKCLEHRYSVLAQEVGDPSQFGIFKLKGNRVKGFVEKPRNPDTNLTNTGLYVLDKTIFSHTLKKSPRGEYELVDYITFLAKSGKDLVCERVSGYWKPTPYPWSLLEANEAALKGARSRIEGKIERNVTVKGTLILGKGSIIKSGTYIECNAAIGENCVIGPNTVLRDRGAVSIGNNCKLINSEIVNSVIMDNTNVHRSYVGDSVIGEGCNLGAGTIIANLRHDSRTIKSRVKGKMVDTGRVKFGTVMGDGCRTGINTSIYPGRKLWPGASTRPGQIVQKDVK